jgi:hypothetical protein
MGWTTPWISLRIVDCYRDVIGMEPISKQISGIGGRSTRQTRADTATLAWNSIAVAVQLRLRES